MKAVGSHRHDRSCFGHSPHPAKEHHSHKHTVHEQEEGLKMEEHALEIAEKFRAELKKKFKYGILVKLHRDGHDHLSCEGVHLIPNFYKATWEERAMILGDETNVAKDINALERGASIDVKAPFWLE